MLHWETDVPVDTPIEIEQIDRFDARGMRPVYGRGDHIGRRAAFNMDIWSNRNGDLFARFWSRHSEVDSLSLAIRGIPRDAIPQREPKTGFSDGWIPQVLRQRYEDWILAEW